MTKMPTSIRNNASSNDAFADQWNPVNSIGRDGRRWGPGVVTQDTDRRNSE